MGVQSTVSDTELAMGSNVATDHHVVPREVAAIADMDVIRGPQRAPADSFEHEMGHLTATGIKYVWEDTGLLMGRAAHCHALVPIDIDHDTVKLAAEAVTVAAKQERLGGGDDADGDANPTTRAARATLAGPQSVTTLDHAAVDSMHGVVADCKVSGCRTRLKPARGLGPG